jgi:hypothetical protein
LHPEGLQHLCPTSEPNGLALLLHSQYSQVDRHQPILSEQHTKLRMSGDLKQEGSVSSLKEQFALAWSTHWQSAEHKWAGAERQSPILLLASDSDKATALGLLELLLGNEQFRSQPFEDRARRLKSWGAARTPFWHTSGVTTLHSSPPRERR